MSAASCGPCRACCRDLAIDVPGLSKPLGTMCQLACSTGCRVYATRPQVCVDYECFWLTSQNGPEPLPKQLRPDQCGVIFDQLSVNGAKVMAARTQAGDSPRAMRQARVVKVVAAMVSIGLTVVVQDGHRTSRPIAAANLKARTH